jgi:hypothetical protein
MDGDALFAQESQGTPPHNRLWGIGQRVFGKQDWDNARHWLVPQWTEKVTGNKRDSVSDLSDDEKTQLGDYINDAAGALQAAWTKQKKRKAEAQAA